MTVFGEIKINASAEKVWQILAKDFATPHNWASSVNEARATGEVQASGAPCDGRVCETSLGPFTEKIRYYSDQSRKISYSAQGDKMPSFVTSMVVTWEIVPNGKTCMARMQMDVGLKFPFNILMVLPMKLQLGGVAKQAREELQFFAENGKPHPRKVKAAGKFRAKNPAAVM